MSQEERSNIIRFGKKNQEKQKPAKSQGDEKQHRSPRNTALYIGSVIILVIVVVTFIGGPAVGSAVGGANRVVFGEYDGTEIAFVPGNYFARQYEILAEQARDAGDTESFELQLRSVWRQAFNRTVFHTAVMAEAEESGMTVSERRIDRQVAQSPRFQENGRFSAEAYQRASSTEKFQLRNYLRQTLIYDQFISDKISNLRHSEAELDFFKSMNSPERQFQFARFAFSDYPTEEVVSYGEENSFRFQNITLSSITVTSSEQDAESILQQYEERTASFEDLARTHSRDMFAEDGGAMGETYYYELERDFEDTDVLSDVFALEAGEVSGVLETTFGWVIYRAEEAAEQPDFTDPEMVETVRSYLNSFERGRVEDFMRERAQEFAAQARQDGFEDAAAEFNIEPILTGFFPINYGNAPFFSPVQTDDGNQISNAAFRDTFFEAGFSLEQDEVSEPVVLRDFIAVLTLVEERTPDEESLDFVESYFPFVLQQYQAEEVERTTLDQDKLVDNFSRTFNQYVIGQ
jgi:parvulin-like peptidyl-prolyl isomerase